MLPYTNILNYPPQNKDRSFPDPESMIDTICSLGIECELVKTVLAAQVVTYHINLLNPLEISKLNKVCKALSAITHRQVNYTHSDIAHIAIICTIQRRIEYFKTLMEDVRTIENRSKHRLFSLIGKDINNNAIGVNISNMPHVLIAGATGSGKSVLLNSMITSILFNVDPKQCQLVLIDPKQVEFKNYEGLPHLAVPIAKNCNSAIRSLNGLCKFMDDRYKLMARLNIKDAEKSGLPSLIIVIDELADLMLTSRFEAETPIIRLAQLGRAAGIHLIIATQRPTANVITGLIKSNIPCKIALQTASIRDSINILDHKGAESLTGKGDALLKLPDQVEEIRFQSAFITSSDIENTVNFWKNQI